MDCTNMKIIARMKSDFPTKFGIPRQSGLVDSLHSMIIFEPAYRNADALRGLENFSHLWIIWQFSESVREDWSATVRPPRLGGNTRLGVFATRSPFRPNPLGLSSVKILDIESTHQGPVIHVAGADLMDGTPIFDIKPYLAYADSHPDASGGFTDQAKDFVLSVDFPEGLQNKVPIDKRQVLTDILSHDPRPAYQNDNGRIYGMSFSGMNVRFTVTNDCLKVLDIE